ncbi:hypothetical protein D046_4466, partial [Vibrio parahaemolyticus V-223/04]
MQGEHQHA